MTRYSFILAENIEPPKARPKFGGKKYTNFFKISNKQTNKQTNLTNKQTSKQINKQANK